MLGKGSIKFLKIFLEKKSTEYSMLFIRKTVFWDTGHLWSRKYLLRRNVLIWFQASSSASFHTKILIRIHHLLSSRQYLPMFCGHKKQIQPCKILVPKTQKVMFLTFSSYSINILTNYLNFLNLASFPILRHLVLVIWYCDSKTTKYSVLLFFVAKSNVLELIAHKK